MAHKSEHLSRWKISGVERRFLPKDCSSQLWKASVGLLQKYWAGTLSPEWHVSKQWKCPFIAGEGNGMELQTILHWNILDSCIKLNGIIDI